MRTILSIIVIYTLLFGGCNRQSRLDMALDMAGENKNNLIKTLDHYRDDSLKYQAAVFLIENMPYHHGWHHNDTLQLNSYYHALQGSNIPAEQIYDSIRNKYGEYDVNNKCLRKDIENVDAEFLIDHIDTMFDIWMNSPWHKDVSFQTFCHHILPYRIRDEDVKPYLRYKSPRDGYCDISEISFYDKDGNLLKGVPIGTQNSGTYDADFTIEKGFDGNPYTSFHYENPDDGWIGLKLYEPNSIARIVFTPRNRKNFIQPGNIYELFYCKDQWISAGIIVADSDSLLYSVPEDALLYLKNHSEGNQERIFDITEDGQRWL